jgi:hypothetical protein
VGNRHSGCQISPERYVVAVYSDPSLLNHTPYEFTLTGSDFKERPFDSVGKVILGAFHIVGVAIQIKDKESRRRFVASPYPNPSFSKELNEAFKFESYSFAKEIADTLYPEYENKIEIIQLSTLPQTTSN